MAFIPTAVLLCLTAIGVAISSRAVGGEVIFPDPALEVIVRNHLEKPTGPILSEDLARIERLRITDRSVRDLTSDSTAGAEPAASSIPEPPLFPDENLESVIRAQLGVPSGPIVREALLTLTKLDGSFKEINDLSGLELLTNLANVNLTGNDIHDLRPLATLRKIERLFVSRNRIEDLSPLASLHGLHYFIAADNRISTMAPLASLSELWHLDLSRNPVDDPESIQVMTGLTNLTLDGMGLASLEFVAPLRQLSKLSARENRIVSLEPVRELRNLIELNLSGNQIRNIEPLFEARNLYRLDLRDNRVTHLDGIPGFTKKATVLLFGNRIEDVRPLFSAFDATSESCVELGGNLLGADAFCRDIPALAAQGVQVVYEFDYPLEKATRFPDAAKVCALAARPDADRMLAAVNGGATDEQLTERFSGEPVAVAAADRHSSDHGAGPSAELAVTLADTEFNVSVASSGLTLQSLLGAIALLGVTVLLVIAWRIPRQS